MDWFLFGCSAGFIVYVIFSLIGFGFYQLEKLLKI